MTERVKLTRDDFARKCGVSKMAISKAVRRGEVVEDDAGKVDTADPANRAYLQADHAVMKRTKAKAREKVSRDGRGVSSRRQAVLRERNTIAQIRQRDSTTAKNDVERARKLDLYTERRMVETVFAAFGAEWQTQIIDMPKRLIPLIYEKCQAGIPLQEAIIYAEKQIVEATRALKEKASTVGLGDLTA